MTEGQNKAAIEAILFASGEPVSLDKLAQALALPEGEAASLLRSLMADWNREDSGVHIVELNGEYQMCSNKAFAPQVRQALALRRNAPLSPAAMEVLAVVAYNQPVTRAFVEQVRGVDCSGVVASLVDKGLLEEQGRLELPGRPLLYGTTANFLRCMGIRSLEELPPLPDGAGGEMAVPEQIKVADEV